MDEERSTHRPLVLLAGVELAAALLALTASWLAVPPMWSFALVLLIAAVVISENYAVEYGGGTISISFPLNVAAIVLLGPTSAAVVGFGAATTLSDLRRKKPLSRILLNLSTIVLTMLAAGWTYVWLGGRTLATVGSEGIGYQPLSASDFPGIVVPLAAAALVAAVGNVALTSVPMSVIQGVSYPAFLRRAAWIVPNEFALAFVGFFIAQVIAVAVVGFVLFVAPLMVARQVYVRYLQLRESYADTVRSLVGVLEAKDPYTKGHSERVAAYAIATAGSMGFDSVALERLEYAALLHDIGKIAVARSILVKPGRLTEAEYSKIREHPGRGADIVARVPALADIVAPIRSHHEWFDGGGYSEGLRGEDIPPMARVMSVADAFDAMTTSRPYRPARTSQEGVLELMRMSGTQFDPAAVDAFITSGAPSLYSPVTLASEGVHGSV